MEVRARCRGRLLIHQGAYRQAEPCSYCVSPDPITLFAASLLAAPFELAPQTLCAPHRHLKASVELAPQMDCAPHKHLLPESVELLDAKAPAPQTLCAPQRHLVPATVEVESDGVSNCQIETAFPAGEEHKSLPARRPLAEPEPVAPQSVA